MGSCGSWCKLNYFKVIFTVGNVLILILGIIFIVISRANFKASSETDDVVHLKNHSALSRPGVAPLLVVGSIMVATAILGIFGVFINIRILNTVALLSYASIMTILAGLITYNCTVALLLSRQVLFEKVQPDLKEHFDHKTLKTFSTDSFNKLEKYYECCGVNGPNDYKLIMIGDLVPTSCCRDKEMTSCTIKDAFKEGCADKLTDITLGTLRLTSGIGMATAVLIFILGGAGIYYGLSTLCKTDVYE